MNRSRKNGAVSIETVSSEKRKAKTWNATVWSMSAPIAPLAASAMSASIPAGVKRRGTV